MNTAVINIKTSPDTKTQAQQVAKKLGVSLSALINGFLRHMIKTKRVEFSLDEEPSQYLIDCIKQSEKDWKEGNVVRFNSGEKLLEYLDKEIANEKTHSR